MFANCIVWNVVGGLWSRNIGNEKERSILKILKCRMDKSREGKMDGGNKKFWGYEKNWKENNADRDGKAEENIFDWEYDT